MKLIDSILFALSAVFFVIGVHYVITTNSMLDAYWIFMLSMVFFLMFRIRKNKRTKKDG